MEIGAVALDASFTPVRAVNYEVENMRVGDRTDFNRLRLHVVTDGSLSPREALKEAALILVSQFQGVVEIFTEGSEPSSEASEEAVLEEGGEEGEEEEVSKKKIEDLDLSTRTMNALNAGGVKTVGVLTKKTEKKLKELEGLGDKGIQEIRRELGNLGLTLKD